MLLLLVVGVGSAAGLNVVNGVDRAASIVERALAGAAARKESRRLDDVCEEGVVFDFRCDQNSIYAGIGCEDCRDCEYFVALDNLVPKRDWSCGLKNRSIGLECRGDALAVTHCSTGYDFLVDPGTDGWCACADDTLVDTLKNVTARDETCVEGTVDFFDCRNGELVQGKNCDTCGALESCDETKDVLGSWPLDTLKSCETSLVGVALSCDEKDDLTTRYCATNLTVTTSVVPEVACGCEANCEEDFVTYACDEDGVVLRGTGCDGCDLESCDSTEEARSNPLWEPMLSCETSPVGAAFSCDSEGIWVTVCSVPWLPAIPVDDDFGCSCARDNAPWTASMPKIVTKVLNSTFELLGLAVDVAEQRAPVIIEAIIKLIGVVGAGTEVDVTFRGTSTPRISTGKRKLLLDDARTTVVAFFATVEALPGHVDAVARAMTAYESSQVRDAILEAAGTDADFMTDVAVVVDRDVSVSDAVPTSSPTPSSESSSKSKKNSSANLFIPIIVAVALCCGIAAGCIFFSFKSHEKQQGCAEEAKPSPLADTEAT